MSDFNILNSGVNYKLNLSAIIPQNAAAKLRNNGGIKIIGAENIKDALDVLFS
ncbi:MAG TPA: hypothetical protein VHO28_03190 [Ignavibacteriales bacterium]|nr:hypothetical protein [Ignavibacteriales bacterium]